MPALEQNLHENIEAGHLDFAKNCRAAVNVKNSIYPADKMLSLFLSTDSDMITSRQTKMRSLTTG